MIKSIKLYQFLYFEMLILRVLLADLSRNIEVFICLVARNVTSTSAVRHTFPMT